MNEDTARANISKYFPDLKIEAIQKIGEGTGNVAFEVNHDLIFRFPKRIENQRQLEQEISIQPSLKTYSSLSFPEFTFVPYDHSFVGYKKLTGTSLLHIRNKFDGWSDLLTQLGIFLGRLHSIPIGGLHVQIENFSGEGWKKKGMSFFEKTKQAIPEKYHASINTFFQSNSPENTKESVLCHNDLGIEHILVAHNKISGIIDWGGVAITDPACDFARLYRDVGEDALDQLLHAYTKKESNTSAIRERAIFYGKCLFFEDLYYGLEQEEFLQKSMDALTWMF